MTSVSLLATAWQRCEICQKLSGITPWIALKEELFKFIWILVSCFSSFNRIFKASDEVFFKLTKVYFNSHIKTLTKMKIPSLCQEYLVIFLDLHCKWLLVIPDWIGKDYSISKLDKLLVHESRGSTILYVNLKFSEKDLDIFTSTWSWLTLLFISTF